MQIKRTFMIQIKAFGGSKYGIDSKTTRQQYSHLRRGIKSLTVRQLLRKT